MFNVVVVIAQDFLSFCFYLLFFFVSVVVESGFCLLVVSLCMFLGYCFFGFVSLEKSSSMFYCCVLNEFVDNSVTFSKRSNVKQLGN